MGGSLWYGNVERRSIQGAPSWTFVSCPEGQRVYPSKRDKCELFQGLSVGGGCRPQLISRQQKAISLLAHTDSCGLLESKSVTLQVDFDSEVSRSTKPHCRRSLLLQPPSKVKAEGQIGRTPVRVEQSARSRTIGYAAIERLSAEVPTKDPVVRENARSLGFQSLRGGQKSGVARELLGFVESIGNEVEG